MLKPVTNVIEEVSIENDSFKSDSDFTVYSGTSLKDENEEEEIDDLDEIKAIDFSDPAFINSLGDGNFEIENVFNR